MNIVQVRTNELFADVISFILFIKEETGLQRPAIEQIKMREHTYALTENNKVKGVFQYILTTPENLHILYMFLAPELRNKGIASQLAVTHIAGTSATTISFLVEKTNNVMRYISEEKKKLVGTDHDDVFIKFQMPKALALDLLISAK